MRTRKVFVYDPLLKRLVEKPIEDKVVVHDIMPDLPDFVSSVDRSVVHGRAGLRSHNKRHNVTNPADYKNCWADFQKKRERMMRGEDNDKKRTETIARAFNELQYGERKPPDQRRERDER